MITDKPPLQRIWSCLRAIRSDAGAAQETTLNIMCAIPDALGYLSPLSGLKNITEDAADFEKEIEAIENAADSAAADLSDTRRYTRMIRGALDEMRKEAENG